MGAFARGSSAAAIVLAIGSASWADVQASGSVTYVSADVVEVGGRRALVTAESHVMSGGREVSVTSLRPGMYAEAEIDDSGNLIVLEANGVVE